MIKTETISVGQPSVIKRIAMMTGILIASAVALFITSAFLANVIWNGLEAGEIAPSFSGRDLSGNEVRLEDYAGKPVIVTFWSPYCSACLEELPVLQTIANDSQAEVALVTIVSKLPTAEVQQFMQDQGLTFPVIVDEPGGIATEYEITGVPVSYFINPDGSIDHSIIGADREGALENNLFTWLSTCNLSEVCK